MTEYEGYSSSDAAEGEGTEVESLVEQVEVIRQAEQVQVVLLLFILLYLLAGAVYRAFSSLF